MTRPLDGICAMPRGLAFGDLWRGESRADS